MFLTTRFSQHACWKKVCINVLALWFLQWFTILKFCPDHLHAAYRFACFLPADSPYPPIRREVTYRHLLSVNASTWHLLLSHHIVFWKLRIKKAYWVKSYLKKYVEKTPCQPFSAMEPSKINESLHICFKNNI